MPKNNIETQLEDNNEIQIYLKTADDNFAAIGYKEHGLRHAHLTANISSNVLKFLGFKKRDIELAHIAGYLHDIGNAVGENDHAQNGALLTLDVMEKMNLNYRDIFPIVSAIGSHEDKDMEPPSPIAAAVILGDKSDVHRTRVRSKNLSTLDTHGRVNYACERAFLRVDKESRTISLELAIDQNICPVMDYFEIFMSRTRFCIKASRYLGCDFMLYINDNKLL